MRIEHLSLSFGVQEIFDDVSIHITENDKIGVIGVNGAGKTTLFKVLLGQLDNYSGKVVFKPNTRIAYLPQLITDEIPSNDISVFEFLLLGRPIKALETELQNKYEEASIEKDDKKLNYILNRISKILSELDYWDSYQAENILLKIIFGMNISNDLLDLKLCNISGGQKSKVAFARLLYSKPEFLLLDEPTNHLDYETRDYIINYLKNYNGTILVVSHDIDFLNAVTTKTMYINKLKNSIELFTGNYSEYMRQRQEFEKGQLRLLEKQEKEEEKLKKIISKYIRGNEKKANIAKDRQKKLAKLESEKVIIERKAKVTKLNLEINYPSELTPLKVDNLSFGYNTPLFNNLTFDLTRGEKFLIVGENGVGKSTLLKLIIGELIYSTGTIKLGDKTTIGYYAQEHELLNNDATIIENFKDSGLDIGKIRSLLGAFLFYGDDINKKINVLSPGERSRVALAKLSVKKANFLILDEPTNHLDKDTQEIIAETFKTYPGTMLLVSHNIDFVKSLGIERILLLPEGKIMYYDENIVKHYQELNTSKINLL